MADRWSACKEIRTGAQGQRPCMSGHRHPVRDQGGVLIVCKLLSVLVMVGLHGRVSAHERMLCASAARGALSVASVMRGSGIFLRLPGSPAGLTS